MTGGTMRLRSKALSLCVSTACLAASLNSTVYGQGPADLLYSPERFLQTPSLYSGFRLEPPAGGSHNAQDGEGEETPKRVTLRAGIVDEIVDEPGKIKVGDVAWSLERSVTGNPLARGRVRIGKETALELTILRRHPAYGSITITIIVSSGLGMEPSALATPRMRRTAAAEGEPLFGRVQRRTDREFTVELSDQPVDVENNLDRLLTRPWMDLIFRDKDGVEAVVTMELGRSGAAILEATIR